MGGYNLYTVHMMYVKIVQLEGAGPKIIDSSPSEHQQHRITEQKINPLLSDEIERQAGPQLRRESHQRFQDKPEQK